MPSANYTVFAMFRKREHSIVTSGCFSIWGFDGPEKMSKQIEVSDKAKENGPRYAVPTAQNAAAAVERKGQKAGRG